MICDTPKIISFNHHNNSFSICASKFAFQASISWSFLSYMYAKLYVWTYLCKNLSIAKLSTPYFSLYVWLSFSPILFFMKELCAILSLLFASNFWHKIKQVQGWGGGGVWSTRMVENFASSLMGHISHYKNTIQFIGQFYWTTSKNALNVLLRLKFALLGINVTLRNWLIGLWMLKTPYVYWVVFNVDNLGS